VSEGLILESFDRRTLANMEFALERACGFLGTGGEQHRTRRHIANRIVRCAQNGNRSLGALTVAALGAARELRIRRRRPVDVSIAGSGSQGGLAARAS
jgi:hypothetical protein